MMPTTLALRTSGPVDTRRSDYQDLKSRIHQTLLDRLDLDRLAYVKREDAEPEIRQVIIAILERETETTPLSLSERERLTTDVLNELLGLGPLEELLRDPAISDVLVNRFDQVYIEWNGVLELTQVAFKDDRHLMRIIERIVSAVGRRIDESSPMVDARLADGSRVNAVIPPIALGGVAGRRGGGTAAPLNLRRIFPRNKQGFDHERGARQEDGQKSVFCGRGTS